jgi:hypothetical protein
MKDWALVLAVETIDGLSKIDEHSIEYFNTLEEAEKALSTFESFMNSVGYSIMMYNIIPSKEVDEYVQSLGPPVDKTLYIESFPGGILCQNFFDEGFERNSFGEGMSILRQITKKTTNSVSRMLFYTARNKADICVDGIIYNYDDIRDLFVKYENM